MNSRDNIEESRSNFCSSYVSPQLRENFTAWKTVLRISHESNIALKILKLVIISCIIFTRTILTEFNEL